MAPVLILAVVLITGTVLAEGRTLESRETNGTETNSTETNSTETNNNETNSTETDSTATNGTELDLGNTPGKGFFSWITGKENYPSEKVKVVVESHPALDKFPFNGPELKHKASDNRPGDVSQKGRNKSTQGRKQGRSSSSDNGIIDIGRLEGETGPANKRHLPPDWEMWMQVEALPPIVTEEPSPDEGTPVY